MTEASTLILIRPGHYAVSVSLGPIQILPGAELAFTPIFAGDVLNSSSLILDTLWLSQGIMPEGLMIGVPYE